MKAGTKIDYAILEKAYKDATFGTIEPNVLWTSVAGYNYIKERFRSKERDPFLVWSEKIRKDSGIIDPPKEP